MDTLIKFLVELTKDSIGKPDICMLSSNIEEPPYKNEIYISTYHGNRLHRIYWHASMVHGLRDWWNPYEPV